MNQQNPLLQLAMMLAEQVKINTTVRTELDALQATLIDCDPERKVIFEGHLKDAEKEQTKLPASQTVAAILTVLEQVKKQN